MSIDSLTASIIAQLAPDAHLSLSFSSSYGTWKATAYRAPVDEYQEQGEIFDRIYVVHVDVEGATVCSITARGIRCESAEAVLEALLEFVRTETPVPA